MDTREYIFRLNWMNRIISIGLVIGWSRRVLRRRKRDFVSGRHTLLMMLIMMSSGHHLMMRLLVILMMHARMSGIIDGGLIRVFA